MKVIKYICADRNKLALSIIFGDLSYHIGNFIHTKREGKGTMVYSKNVCTNVVLGQGWLKYFDKDMVDNHTVDTVNESMINR